MSIKKILNNLYLGDCYNITQNYSLIISCSEEIFYEQINKFNIKNINKEYFWLDNKHIFFNFKDCPTIKEFNINTITKVLNIIKNNIKNKKIYIYCIWGINRSASIVFIYLVLNKYINDNNFNISIKQFKKIYPYIKPNSEWYNFLLNEFPYKKFNLH